MTTPEALQEQGTKLFQDKDFEEALKVFQEAHDGFAAASKPDMVAEMKSNIGLLQHLLGNSQEALDAMQAALQTFQEREDAKHVAMVLGNMGRVYVGMGDKEQAYNAYRQAADIFQELGEKNMYGETLIAMGDLQLKDGKLMMGAATYEAGLEQLDQLSMTQKVMKGLIGVRNKFTGGG